MPSEDKQLTRRHFLRRLGRTLVAGGLGAAGGFLAARRLQVESDCVSRNPCRACGIRQACNLPKRRKSMTADKRPKEGEQNHE